MFQIIRPRLLTAILPVLAAATSINGLSWGETRFLVTFGDSYTTDGELEFCCFLVKLVPPDTASATP